MHWMLLPYRRYADFSGRSRRREYWLFMLFYVGVFAALGVLLGTREVVSGPGSFYLGAQLTGAGRLIAGLFWMVSFVPHIAVAVRRLHDQERSGWMLLLAFLPILGWFALFVMFCLEGTHGRNRFGPDPKARADAGMVT